MPERSSTTSSAPGSSRRQFHVIAETLWSRGGSESDTLVSALRGMRIVDGLLQLSDGEITSALTLGARNGRTVTPARRVTVESNGTHYCPAPNGSSWQLVASEPYPLILRSGSTVERREAWPWPGFALEPPLRRQAWLAPGRVAGECVLALMLGRGFARLVDGKAAYVRAYVDTFGLPPVVVTIDSADDRVIRRERLQRRRVAAAAIARVGELLAVAGDGDRGPAAGEIDLYRLDDGVYTGSWRLGAPISALAGDDSTLFVAHARAGRPALVALRLRPEPRQ